MSVKTVEANLSRVYAKLGIGSRVELPARLSKLERAESHQDAQRERCFDVFVCDNANRAYASAVHHEGSIRRFPTARPARRKLHG